jgi:hypothetical protein
MSGQLYKIIRKGGGQEHVWSLGYPTKGSAQAAARRLNKTSPNAGTYTVHPMTGKDYETLAELERLQDE